MYSVIIAEDELLIRIGLDASIPWSSLSMKLEASLSNGQKAWEAYKQYHPSIIITDIKMPVMSGLELARKVREIDSKCRIIIVTCIEDFDMLREFVNLNISGYLLKASTSREEIFEVLKKVKESLDLEDSNEGNSQTIKDEQYTDLLKSYAIQKSLSFKGFEQRRKQLSFSDIQMVMVVQTGISSPDTAISQSVNNILRDRLRSIGECAIVPYENQVYAFFFAPFQLQFDSLQRDFSEMSSYMSQVFSAQIRAAVCKTDSSLETLQSLLSKCRGCVNKPFFYPDSFYLVQDEALIYDKDAQRVVKNLRENPMLLNYIPEGLGWTLPHLTNDLEEAYGKDKSAFETAYQNLSKLLSGIIKSTDFAFQKQTPYNAVTALKGLEKILPTYNPHPVYGDSILKTIEYMKNNPQKNLSLSEVSAMVNLSQNYFATLFKTMLGINYIDYLVRVRVEHACELLKTTDLPLQQISQKCGFGDITYFNRCFKKNIGMPPRQWRISK